MKHVRWNKIFTVVRPSNDTLSVVHFNDCAVQSENLKLGRGGGGGGGAIA